MSLLQEIQRETVSRIEQFLKIVEDIDFNPYYVYHKYLKVYFLDDSLTNPEGCIQILNGDHDELITVTTYKEFLTWYMKEVVKDAYRDGQDNLRKAAKELLGLSV